MEDENTEVRYNLPPFFIEKREELHYLYTTYNLAAWKQDTENRNRALLAYLERVHYITSRLKPLSKDKKETQDINDIEAYALTFPERYDTKVEDGIPQLNQNHELLVKIMITNGLDRLKQKKLELS